MAINEVKEIFERSDSSAAKSTILKSLTWFISIFMSGLIFLLKYDAPFWLVLSCSIVIGLAIIIFLFTFLYCLFKDRDALRSEKYSIQKLALEKGIFGDNISGSFKEQTNNTIGTGQSKNKLGGGQQT